MYLKRAQSALNSEVPGFGLQTVSLTNGVLTVFAIIQKCYKRTNKQNKDPGNTSFNVINN